MGNNSAFTAFEHTIVSVYDRGRLDKELLKVLMEPYRDSDIDSGGKVGLVSKDGLEVEQIVIKVWGLKLPSKPKGKEIAWDRMTEKQQGEWEKYQEAVDTAFNKITDKIGWH